MAVPQLQLANLGEIFAQNQARQASMDNLMLQQQAALEQRQAQQAAAQREAKLREAIASGINPSTPEGLGQLASLMSTEDYFKALDTQSKVKLAGIKGEAAQRTAGAAETRARAAERTAAAREKQVLGQLRINAAQLGISQQNANANYMRLRAAYDKDRAEALGQQAYNLQQLPPGQREPAYQIWRQQKIASGEFKESDLPTDYDEPIVTSIALGYANKHKGTGKPVAVIDPNTGQAVYVAPEQAIGKQVASTRTPGQTEEAKQRQKAIVKAEEIRSEAAANATGIIDSLNRAEQLVASGAATTGPYISKLPTLSAGTAEFEAISNQLGLEGTKLLKGAISEMENKKVQSTQPGNDRTPEANLAIIKFNRSIMQRAVERAKFDSAWRQTKGTIEGADAAWRRFTEENPVTSSKPNDLSINEQNIGNWQGYITGEGKQAQPTPSGGGQGGGIQKWGRDANGNPVRVQ